MSLDFDLFGEPVPPGRGKRGRPAHVRTQESSNKFNLLAATGSGLEEIAAVLGVSMPTLRKHYFFEVERYEVAKLRLKAKLLSGLMTEADGGNVAAAKELFKQVERGELARLAAVKPKKEPKLGKKERVEREAKQPPSSWGELIAPIGESLPN